MSFSIIGGADGPTSVFLAGRLGPDWMNVVGLIIVVLMLIPNVIFARKCPGEGVSSDNRVIDVLEQVGRYLSIFLMIFPVGAPEFGFTSIGAFFVYSIGNSVCILAYWVIWMMFFHKRSKWKRIMLAIIPTCIFVMSGITAGQILLVVSGIIFGACHIYTVAKG